MGDKRVTNVLRLRRFNTLILSLRARISPPVPAVVPVRGRRYPRAGAAIMSRLDWPYVP